jgi:hypothetical protein
MRVIIERLQLRKDFDTLNFLKRALLVLGIWGLVIELFAGYIGWSLIFTLPALYFLYTMLYQTYEKFYYSYWIFNVALFIYILFSLYKSLLVFGNSILAYVYTLMLFANGIKTYIISSPIYFPIVNWWEYDFRFRRDIPIQVVNNEEESEGRIIDIRREAAGIQTFKNFEIGDEIEVKFHKELEGPNMVGTIYSIRKYSLGRPFILGVKFNLTGREGRYQQVVKYWQEKKIELRNLRVQKES